MSQSDIQLDVIAVGAHPDDVEIGCGGALARMVRLGYRVGIIDLTDGEPTPRSTGPEQRLGEARRAAEILGVQVRETLSLPNRRLFDSFESRVALAKVFRRYRPHVVLSLQGRTVLASPDHYQAMLITDAAIFYSRLTKWDDQFGGLPVHTVVAQLGYSLALRPLDLPDATSYFVVDISSELTQKLNAIRAYDSQFPPEKQHVFHRVEVMGRYWGELAGVDAGEVLYTHRAIATDDIMKFVAPAHARSAR